MGEGWWWEGLGRGHPCSWGPPLGTPPSPSRHQVRVEEWVPKSVCQQQGPWGDGLAEASHGHPDARAAAQRAGVPSKTDLTALLPTRTMNVL